METLLTCEQIDFRIFDLHVGVHVIKLDRRNNLGRANVEYDGLDTNADQITNCSRLTSV